ncbi:MAG: hypothetical protein E7632_04035 [Ruminococcaceae bacterium]|nr:hypothetical protein [Oscillospiraceae bacterium]
MTKNAIILMILTSMLASLAACGGSGAVDTTAASDAETTPAETAPAFTPADADYNGEPFIIAENDVGDWMQSAFIEEQNGDVLNDSIYERNRIVEELYNVDIKGCKIEGGRNSQDLSSLKNTILAGDDEFDVAYIPGQLTSKIFTEPDFLVPLSDIDTLDLTNEWWAEKSVEAMTFKGKTLSATGDMIVTTNGSATITFFNKELAEIHNIDMYDVVRQGKFTIDYAHETGKLAQADLDGDTVVNVDRDSFGFCTEALNIMQFINQAGESLVKKDADGVPTSSLDSPRVMDIVQHYIDIIDDTDSVIAMQDGRFKEGGPNVLINRNALFFWITNLQRMNMARTFEADFGVIPFPKWEESEEYTAPLSGFWDSWLMVPATNTELDKAGHICEALGYYGRELVTPAFIETAVTTKALRDDESAEMLEMVLGNLSCDAGIYFDWGYWMLYRMVQNHNGNLASELAKNISAINASIESFTAALD